jgi:hypothetical protein
MFVMGEVTDESPLEVKVWGDATSTAITMRLGSYTPTLGDQVLMVRVGGGLVILGKRVVV